MLDSVKINTGVINETLFPLGRGDTPYYRNAGAFCNAIDNEIQNAIPIKGQEYGLSRHLARPEVHNNNVIDWYVPFESDQPDNKFNVVPWLGASEEERAKARAQLDEFTSALRIYGQQMARRAADSSSANVAAYLNGNEQAKELPAIHFPGPEYVFIVNGIPVITFWGFTADRDKALGSPLTCLNAPSNPFADTTNPFMAGAAPAATMSQEPPPAQEERKKHACILPPWLLWLLLALLLIPLLLWFLWKFFGLFAGLFGALFGAPSLPAVEPSVPAAQEQVVDPPAEPTEDPVVEVPDEETPSEPSDPMNLEIPLPDITLPNVDLQGGSLSGGDLSLPNVDLEGGSISGGDIGFSPDGSVPAGGVQEGADPRPEGQAPSMEPSMSPGADQGADQGAVPAPEQGADPSAEQGAAAEPQEPAVNEPVANQGPMTPPDPLANLSPEQRAAIEAARQAEAKAAGTPPANPNLAAADRALSFNQETLAAQGNKVFNGNWQTRSPLMDSANGRPLQMSYNFKDGQGQVTVTRADGTKCVANSTAAVSGNGIEITNSGRAVCPDKSTYQLPQVRCTDQGDGTVKCQGQVGAQRFPINFNKN